MREKLREKIKSRDIPHYGLRNLEYTHKRGLVKVLQAYMDSCPDAIIDTIAFNDHSQTVFVELRNNISISSTNGEDVWFNMFEYLDWSNSFGYRTYKEAEVKLVEYQEAFIKDFPDDKWTLDDALLRWKLK